MAHLSSKLGAIVAGLLLFVLPVAALAARTDSLWDYISTGNYTQPNGSANGTNLLLVGSNHYLNFGTLTGTSGYGLRDNAGTIEFKNSGGVWAGIGSGSGGGGTGTVGTSTPLSAGQVDFSTGVNTIGNDSTFIWDNTNKRLGLSTSTPSGTLSITGPDASNGRAFVVANNANVERFAISDSGLISRIINPVDTYWKEVQRNTSYVGFLGNGSDYFLNYDTANERVAIGNGGSAGSTLSVSNNTALGAAFSLLAAPTNGLIVQGNTGIGTSTPVATLGISIASTTPALFVGAVGSSTPSLYVGSANSNGYVGIGTAAPTQPLTVFGASPNVRLTDSGSAGGDYQVYNSSGSPQLLAYGHDGSTGHFYNYVGNLSIRNIANGNLTFYTNNTLAFDIDSTQRIGIGSSTPTALLSVTGNGLASGVPQFAIGSSTASALLVGQNNLIGINTTAPDSQLEIYDNLNTTGGSLGQGTGGLRISRSSAPGQYLAINENGGSTHTIRAYGSKEFAIINSAAGPNASGNINFYTNYANLGTAGLVLSITPTAKVGIGTTTPWIQFESASSSPQIGWTNPGAGTNLKHWYAFADGLGALNFGTSTDASATSTPYNVTFTNSGTVGVGTSTPGGGSTLAVAGSIYSGTGGFRFPDGTTQTTAAAGGGGSTITPYFASSSSAYAQTTAISVVAGDTIQFTAVAAASSGCNGVNVVEVDPTYKQSTMTASTTGHAIQNGGQSVAGDGCSATTNYSFTATTTETVVVASRAAGGIADYTSVMAQKIH